MSGAVQYPPVEPIKFGFRWRENQESKLFTRRFYFSQFSAASTSATLDLTAFAGGIVIEGAFVWIPVAWTGGAVSATTFSAGTTGSATAYINAVDVFTANLLVKAGVTQTPGTVLNTTTPTASGTIRLTVTTTSANTNALTAGSVDLFLRLRAIRLHA